MNNVGLTMRAYDINGNEIHGMHHQMAVRYVMIVGETGEILQEWLTDKHPDRIAAKKQKEEAE